MAAASKLCIFPGARKNGLERTTWSEAAVEGGGGKDNGLCPSFATTLRLQSLGCRGSKALIAQWSLCAVGCENVENKNTKILSSMNGKILQ